MHKTRSTLPILIAFALCATALAPAAERIRSVQSFDAEWLFAIGDAPSGHEPMFDDATWRVLDVPHDWAIEGELSQSAPVGRGGGYRPSGVSWYRKRFSLPADAAGKRVFVEFDGVMANSEVWINGQRLGRRPFGYVSFAYELTGLVEIGEDKTNLLAVRTDTTVQPASRWYSGQGIYRHVRLVVTDPVRIEQWGLYVTTPQVTAERATVRVHASVVNGGDQARELGVHFALLDPSGREVASADAPARRVTIGETVDFVQDITVERPTLWDVGQGHLYQAVATVRANDVALDDDVVTFGIRDARFEAATGFWLNGRNVRLQGACLHHDGGAFGAAVPLRVWERRLERLREVGINAIRTAHNPPAPEFLDLCDRMGFLVMDELFDAWTVGKPHAEKGYNLHFTEWAMRDARDTIRRDRNHPSIVLYSTGNEIHDTPKSALAKNILARLIGVIHAEDPTRPVTQALFRPNVSRDYHNGLADMLDVVGQNYRENELIAAHRQKPTRIVIGTEQQHDPGVWVAMRDHPFIAGQFIWAGLDYLGEADWPFTTSSSGVLDRAGQFKPRAFQRASFWSDQPVVHIARNEPGLAQSDPRRRTGFDRVSNWTPLDPASYTEATLDVYSNCEEVELFLNGRSLGSQPKPANETPRTWKVAYEAGTVRAVGRNGGREVATHELKTAGAPVRLVVEVDRTNLTPTWDDVATVTVTAVDANGVPSPWANETVTFSVSGPGVVAAVDNGDRRDHAPFQASERKLFQGTCLAFIKATDASGGRITVTASAPGLASVEVAIEVIESR